MTKKNDMKEPNLWDVTKSVLSAFLGVQSRKNYERDFSYGKPWQYILIGLIGVGVFIGLIITVVSIVLSNVGG